ncbi:MAG: hypothetical protein BGP06_17900 [Rhizobiales bacterium 65-9]|nr:MAG: hypothetical protein BGP06_17900 [Rhizobiales bacterium 65-9]
MSNKQSPPRHGCVPELQRPEIVEWRAIFHDAHRRCRWRAVDQNRFAAGDPFARNQHVVARIEERETAVRVAHCGG